MFSRPPVDRIAFLGVSWYGILILLGILCAIFIAKREERRLELPWDTAIDFSLFAIPLGIIGARLYSVLFRLADYSENWMQIFNLREGGLAIAGAVLGGLLAAWLVARRRRISMWSVCDMAVPGLVLAQAIGRWGNYFNVEAYGIRISDPAWQFFPIAIEVPVSQTWYWHMATFFYESMWDLMVFALLMLMRRGMRKTGDMFCWYLMLYGVGRTLIEGLRSDSLTFYNEFVRVSQILFALGCVAIALYFFIRQRGVRRIRGAKVNDILLLVSVALGLATTFLGEFERGAYGNLFMFSQALVFTLLALNVAIIVLRLVRRCPFHPMHAAQWALTLWFAALLLAGIGREYADNTVYVTMRQLPSMLQIALCGAIFYYAPFPAARRKRPRPADAPSPT